MKDRGGHCFNPPPKKRLPHQRHQLQPLPDNPGTRSTFFHLSCGYLEGTKNKNEFETLWEYGLRYEKTRTQNSARFAQVLPHVVIILKTTSGGLGSRTARARITAAQHIRGKRNSIVDSWNMEWENLDTHMEIIVIWNDTMSCVYHFRAHFSVITGQNTKRGTR